MRDRPEAGSLSALNLLAANPPRYPVNPAEEPRDPLTLYIARVPGTRDVILSTLKPHRKNVTFEDVANALYYVHLDLPSDGLLAAAPPAPAAPSASGAAHSPAAREPVARKPVPSAGHADPPTHDPTSAHTAVPPLPPPPPHVHLPAPAPQPWIPPGFRLDEQHSLDAAAPAQRQDQGQDRDQDRDQEQPPALPVRPRPVPGGSSAPIARKPVGAVDKALPLPPAPREAQEQQARPAHGDDEEPPPPPLPTVPRPTASGLPRPPSLLSPPPSTSGAGHFVPFQLTLIRRDPSSNHQWNIGKIRSVQAAEPPQSPTQLPPSSSSSSLPLSLPDAAAAAEPPSICIQIDTSGYAKFRGDDGGPAGRQDTFVRQVTMAYAKSWTAGLRNAFKRASHERAASDGGGGLPADPSGFGADEATAGRGSRASYEAGRDARDAAGARDARSGLKPKGYTFASPWDGRCEFRTGNGGRSLKCRHVLHPAADAATGAVGGGGGVAGYNPLVIAQGLRDGQGLAAVAAPIAGAGAGRARATSLSSALSGAVAVSELRFNLPRRAHEAGDDGSGSGSRDAGRGGELYGRFQDHLHHLQQHARHRRGSSTTDDDGGAGDDDDGDHYGGRYGDDDDDDDALGLSLGRERAGGGARGKRAKLGKLIVYDDGFKMLDLVVAANMGVWWVSWERSF